MNYRGSGTTLPADLHAWTVSLPPKLKERFVEIGLMDRTAAEAGKDLAGHIEAFRDKLRMGFKPKMGAGKTSDIHVKQTTARVQKIVDACGFRRWADINLDRVQNFLSGLGASDATFNAYRRDFGQFCRWMQESGRADTKPKGTLPKLEIEDDGQDKRAFTLDELQRLITTTAQRGKTRQGCTARDRAALYVVAAETGLRRNEIKSLRVDSFDLDDGSVTLAKETAKNRKAATIPLKAKRARQLREYFRGKSPREAAFLMNKYARTYAMIEGDLRYARARWIRETKDRAGRRQRWGTDFLKYIDDNGQKGCFHSLRNTFCTNLDRTDASLAERMTLARHSKRGSLTLDRYTDVRLYNLRRIVEKLPDLPFPGYESEAQVMRATGTDGKSGASNGAFPGESGRTTKNAGEQQPLMAVQNPRFQRGRRGSNPQPSDRQSDALTN